MYVIDTTVFFRPQIQTLNNGLVRPRHMHINDESHQNAVLPPPNIEKKEILIRGELIDV